MKGFAKGLLKFSLCVLAIPLFLVIACALAGLIGLTIAAPGAMLMLIGILFVISIPGIIVGVLISHK